MLFEYLPTLFSDDRYAKVKAEASLHPVPLGAKVDIFSDGYVIFYPKVILRLLNEISFTYCGFAYYHYFS